MTTINLKEFQFVHESVFAETSPVCVVY